MTHLEVLESELREFQLDLPSRQKTLLSRYCDELDRWNQKINLTGLRGSEMVRRLVVEPVWIARQLQFVGTLVDIGSGNGSPAIPIAVVSQLEKAHLVEVRTRRAAFLRHAVNSLDLSVVEVHRARFEEMASKLGSVDWVTLQGVLLTQKLIHTIRDIATTTQVVWITSGGRAPIQPAAVFEVPITKTKVLLFRLDLS